MSRQVLSASLPTSINFDFGFENNESKSTYVTVESLLTGENAIVGLEDYIDSYIDALFGVSFEEFTKLHNGTQFSMFIKVSKQLQEDLNYQFKSWKVLSSEIEVNDREIHAIISLTFGSRKHGIYQNDSVFYSNKFVELTLTNRANFLKSKLENAPEREPGEGWNQYCGRLKNLLK